jgi:signal transduction histidine kinase
MVATFNHEINNPLTIALGSLRRDFSKIDERRVTIAVNALERISDIVKKIEKVTKLDQIEEEVYVENTKMIKIK